MSWVGKLRPQGTAAAPAQVKSSVVPAAASSPNARSSNGLKEFLWLVGDIPSARILDIGAVSQSTINFFIQKGFRLSNEDLLRAWKDFVAAEEERARANPSDDSAEQLSAASLASRFLDDALKYPAESIHGIVAWDLLDYFDVAATSRFLDRIYEIMHPGGALLCLFHSKPPASFHRYRIIEGTAVEQVPASTVKVHTHVFQNREIQDLFGRFRSSKTFVGRDQTREALFLK